MPSSWDASRRAPNPAPIRAWRVYGWPLLTAMFLMWGLLISAACEAGNSFSDGVCYCLFYGLFALFLLYIPLSLVIIAIAIVRKRLSSPAAERVLPVLGLAACIAMIIQGYLGARPTERFRRFVIDPPPASVRDVQAYHGTTFGDGDSYFFAFHIAPTDFDLIRKTLSLQRVTSLSAPTNAAKEPGDFLCNEEARIQRHSFDVYRQPNRPEFFRSGKTVVAVDGDHSSVYFLVDRYVDYAPPTTLPGG